MLEMRGDRFSVKRPANGNDPKAEIVLPTKMGQSVEQVFSRSGVVNDYRRRRFEFYGMNHLVGVRRDCESGLGFSGNVFEQGSFPGTWLTIQDDVVLGISHFFHFSVPALQRISVLRARSGRERRQDRASDGFLQECQFFPQILRTSGNLRGKSFQIDPELASLRQQVCSGALDLLDFFLDFLMVFATKPFQILGNVLRLFELLQSILGRISTADLLDDESKERQSYTDSFYDGRAFNHWNMIALETC